MTNIKEKDEPGYVWFKFYASDWLTDPDVLKMSAADRGVYITRLAGQWRDNWLPVSSQLVAKCLPVDSRMVARWLLKWNHLFAKRSPTGNQMANEKLWNLAVAAGKIALLENTDEMRLDENRSEENQTQIINESGPVEASVSDLSEQGEETLTPAPVPVQFPVKDKSGEPGPELAAKKFFIAMGKPASHKKSAQQWEAGLAVLQKQSKLPWTEFIEFCSWLGTYVSDNPKNSIAEWLPKSKDPMGKLSEKFDWILSLFIAEKKIAGLKADKAQAEVAVKYKNAPAMNQPQNKADFYARNQAAMDEEE
jgi:hypothetical protein